LSVAVERTSFGSFSVPMVALKAVRTMARLLATLIVLTPAFTSLPARADSEYKKVCKIGTDLKALPDDGNANSCRTLAVASNSQEYQLGCQSAKDEDVVILTTPINMQSKSARVTSASLAANALNADQEQRGVGHLRKILGKSITISETCSAIYARLGRGCGGHGVVGRECRRRIPAQRAEMGKAASALDRVSAVSSRFAQLTDHLWSRKSPR
jgi:hypothetical protein